MYKAISATPESKGELAYAAPSGRAMQRTLWLILWSLMLFSSVNAHAGLCAVPAEDGYWRNSNAAANSITWVGFRMECRDVPKTVCNGNVCSTTYAVEPHYFVRLWGKCSPSDCYWGEVEGTAQTGANAGWFRFYYDQGFAKRHVWVRTYPEWPGWLRLWIYTDFTDPGRADYTMDEWFVR